MKPSSSLPPVAAEAAMPAADFATPGACAGTRAWPQGFRDFWTLTKPEISFLVTLSAFAGYLLGTPVGGVSWGVVAALLVGVVLTSGGVGVLNHYLEWRLDAQMKRTAGRPIPAGRVSPRTAFYFGAALVAAGIGILCPLTNPLTGVLGALTVFLYLFVYTPLKRKTVLNTLVGTLPGALPALGGWTAATNDVGPGGWAAFGVLALWQMPHFLSLAWMYRKDYGRARYAMLPVVEPDGLSTVRQTLGFAALLLPAAALPWAAGVAGVPYLVVASLAGVLFLRPALAFYRSRSTVDARRVLMASIWYVPVWFVAIVLDRFI